MKAHEFTLVLTADPSETEADKLYGIIVDGTISTIAGVPQIHFHREAGSLEEAIRSAIGDVRAIGSMFHRHRADVATNVDIQDCILIQVSCLSDLGSLKFDVQRIGILKVLNFHGLNVRSKNTLWTVSPSSSRTTRRYRLSISSIGPSDECDHLVGSLPGQGSR
jgi:hypothetical protein